MQLIGVIDLLAGRAVRARGGARDRYLPVAAIGATTIDGNPLALARAYVDQCGLSTLYAADLDAIDGGETDGPLIRRLTEVAPLWLDAGITTVAEAHRAIDLGAARAVVGLETLTSFDALATICAAFGGAQVAFSLDLRGGVPVSTAALARRDSAEDIAARAAAAGATTIIVIDLARVGAGTGPDFERLSRVRSAVPGVTLFAGGGVRGPADLTRLAGLGCDGALVASALHDGALSTSR